MHHDLVRHSLEFYRIRLKFGFAGVEERGFANKLSQDPFSDHNEVLGTLFNKEC